MHVQRDRYPETQNYCVFGLCPSFGILKIREHNISETGSVSPEVMGGRHFLCWVPYEEQTFITGSRNPIEGMSSSPHLKKGTDPIS
jgi:hypothetical protein